VPIRSTRPSPPGSAASPVTGDDGVAFLAAGVLAVAATGRSLGIRRAPAALAAD
jgi:hypothetical protein